MKPTKSAKASTKQNALASRPPRAVKVRSAEGFMGRLPGVKDSAGRRVSDVDIAGIVRAVDTHA